DVLNHRVVRPVGGEQRLPRPGNRSRADAEVEEQPGRIQGGPVQLLLHRHPTRRRRGFYRGGGGGHRDGRVVLPPCGAVGRRRGARVRPGGRGGRVVAQRDVDDVRERERLDPLREVGREGGGGGGSRPGRVARGALLRRSPEDVRGGRRACDAADARWVGQAPAQRQRERRQRPRPGTARGRGLVDRKSG